ncbi:MAG: ABC transporter substrate-binding protein [Gammaproteobacteria bacterium]|nr:ABC transporter substrate-binding protein [Gammaproteobacteria bacterium]
MFVSIFLLICVATHASELELFTENFPPYNFIGHNEIIGINADILSRACLIADIDCTVSLLPWSRAYKAASVMQNSGVFSTSRNEQRENEFIWVGPLVSSNTCFYRLKTRSDIVVTNSDSLKNYTVGISRNDIYEKVLQNKGFQKGINYLTYSKKHEDTKVFKNGKLDLIIGSSVTLASQLGSAGIKLEDVVPVFELKDDSLVGNFLALNKTTDPIIAAKLQDAIDQLKATGEFESIISSYIGTTTFSDNPLPSNLEPCVDGKANY